MPHHRRLIFVAVGLTIGFILGACSPNLPTGTIEKKYYATGPWAVTTRSDNGYDFYYPTDLGANGFLHPIITWGNGTGGTASNAPYFLNHPAPSRFLIIATPARYTTTAQSSLHA